MITFDPAGRPRFTPNRYPVRPTSGKQFHVMSEYREDCDFTPDELVWFRKFKDNDNAR